ncbi:GHKL domain-containing protein [Myxococcota bacterium]|nr:GHKL domain-containing protein [Myxococcota bacterium]MBU1381082.1 GHKL domain-containing protein [Myxococcota bacterium]MBU1496328.1 GHKL domain-containing protein [Myxococcota bacterium]
MELKSRRSFFKSLFHYRDILFFWFPVSTITILHFLSPTHIHWIHDILRRLYYIPLVYFGFKHGLAGGITGAIFVTLIYFPHAFITSLPMDPGHTVEKLMEIVTYFGAAGVSGIIGMKQLAHEEALRKHLELQNRMQAHLVRRTRMEALGGVVSGLAHELKNPLHIMQGTAEIISDLIPPDSPETKLWENHVSEIHRMERITDRYLSFSREETGALKPTDIQVLLRKTAELYRVKADKSGVIIHLPENTGTLILETDGDALLQVFLNITLNAIEAFEGKSGNVWFKIEEDSNFAVVKILNDAKHIPQEIEEKIFDPFFTTRDDGSGLGLSISQSVVQSMGGFLSLKQEENLVCFEIKIPIN